MLVQCALQWCVYGETRGWISGSQNIAWDMVQISYDVPRLTRWWANNDILVSTSIIGLEDHWILIGVSFLNGFNYVPIIGVVMSVAVYIKGDFARLLWIDNGN